MKIEIDVDADTSIIRKIVIPVEWNRAEQPTNSQRTANEQPIARKISLQYYVYHMRKFGRAELNAEVDKCIAIDTNFCLNIAALKLLAYSCIF